MSNKEQIPSTQSATDVANVPRRGLRRRVVMLTSLATAILVGILIGVGTFTFVYGKGSSYLSNDPNTCINCHVMQEHFDSWQQSSHRHVAVCNDCHLPHDFVGKWVTKADNGLFHSVAFTLQDYHEPIQTKPRNKLVTHQACVACHRDVVHTPLLLETRSWDAKSDDLLSCVHCHFDVGHAFRPYSSASQRE